MGDTLWTRTIGGPYWDEARCVKQTLDGGFIITGSTESIITSNINNNISTKNLAFSNDIFKNKLITDKITSSILDENTSGKDIDIFLKSPGSKYNQGFSGPNPFYNYQYLENSDEEISTNIWLVRTNELGDTLWTRTYGDSGYQAAHSVEQTANGGFIISGLTEVSEVRGKDVWLIRTDAMGEKLWSSSLHRNQIDIAYDCKQTSDGGFIVVGETGYQEDYSDVWLIRLNNEVSSYNETITENPQQFYLEQNYPNPFNSTTTIRYTVAEPTIILLKIYDILGQELRVLVNEHQSPGQKTVTWDGTDQFGKNVSSGMYLYQLEAKNEVQIRKMMLIQ